MAKRYSQPQGGAQIDWSNPLTRGLVYAWVPATDRLTKSGAVGSSVNRLGVGISTNGSSTYEFMNTAPVFGLNECSLTAILTPQSIATASSYAVACGQNASGNPLFMIGNGATSNQLGFRTRDSANTDISSEGASADWAQGVTTVVSGTRSKTAALQRVFAAGKQVASKSVGTAAATTFDRFAIGCLLRSSAALYWSGTTNLVLIHNRALSDAEIKSLSDNPWQIFQPTNRAIYAVAAGSTYTLTADAASYSIAGADASLIATRKLIADTANIPIAGADTTLTYTPIGGPTYTLTADAGSIAVNGNAATLAFNRVLTADAGSYSVAGQAVGLAFNRVLSAATANIPVAGQDVTLTYTDNGFTYTLSAEAGAIGVTGQDARLVWSGEQTTYSGGYEHLGRRQTPKQRKEQRQRLGIIAQDIKEATKKVARAVIADTGRTDPVSHFEDHKAQFLRMLVDELKGYQPPDMADVISRQIRIAYAIQEQEEEEILLLLH